MTNEELLEQQKKAGDTSLADTTEKSAADASLAQESSTVTQTQNYLQSLLKNKPANFDSKYLPQLETLYDKVMNREKFSYDVAGDPLFQQYKNQYAQMGELAMQDTIGNAAALTGGYGNSWAETAGNQAYQAYLQRLTDKVPELYESAFGRYTQEGDDLQTQLALTSELYENDYQKYMDDLAYMQQMQQTAYSQVMSMINAGLTPPDELIAAAGLSKDALGLNAPAVTYAPGPSSNNNNNNNNKKKDTDKTNILAAAGAYTAVNSMNAALDALKKGTNLNYSPYNPTDYGPGDAASLALKNATRYNPLQNTPGAGSSGSPLANKYYQGNGAEKKQLDEVLATFK